MDLITDAENKLDAAIAAEEAGQQPNPDDAGKPPEDDDQPPAGDEDEDQPNGGDDGGEDGEDEEDQPEGDEEENPGEDEEPNPDAAKPKGDEAPKPLTDDELIAELEKRGLKVAKKDEEKQEQPKAPEFKRPDELPDRVWDGMKPVQKYIYQELPYITLKGKDAEGNVSEITVKTPEQIPENFEFASKRDEKIADDAFLEQNKRADQMYGKIQTTSQQTQQQQTQQRENESIISGVEKLQETGVIPKIVAKPGTPEFDKDPGVLRANEILAYRTEILKTGENVSIISAGKMFKADHPELYVAKPAPKGDAERKKASKNVSGGGRGTPAGAKKGDRPKFPPGTSASDIADFYSQDLD